MASIPVTLFEVLLTPEEIQKKKKKGKLSFLQGRNKKAQMQSTTFIFDSQCSIHTNDPTQACKDGMNFKGANMTAITKKCSKGKLNWICCNL